LDPFLVLRTVVAQHPVFLAVCKGPSL